MNMTGNRKSIKQHKELRTPKYKPRVVSYDKKQRLFNQEVKEQLEYIGNNKKK